MAITLSATQARIIGCLLEKEVTTPDQYPLSVNALTNACNQKSNRDPVTNFNENNVRDTLHQLKSKFLVAEQTGSGSRAIKYKHRFCNTEFGDLHFSEQELGIICVLLLRGPQTPGELRSRTNRLCQFESVSEVESVLNTLISRDDGPFVQKLAREPGKRESRYTQLFSTEASGALEADESVENSPSTPSPAQSPAHDTPSPHLSAVHDDTHEARISALEEQVQLLQDEVRELRTALMADRPTLQP